MLTVALSADDFAKDGQYVRLGRVVSAIVRAYDSSDQLNAERDAIQIVNAGVQLKLLNPRDPGRPRNLPRGDWGNGIVPLAELVEWGRSTKQFDFRIPAPVGLNQPEDVQTIASDESTCDTAELVRNGEPIQWAEYWLNRQEITPQQAAKLAHCIDPIKWPADQCKQGQISDALRIKIQRCAEMLAERNNTWTLAALLEALGNDAAPYGMRQAASLKVGANETATETPQERRAIAAQSAKGVKREILEHWDGIAKTNGPDADAAKVARYLKSRRDASEKAPQRKTIHNRLGELRAAKLIP